MTVVSTVMSVYPTFVSYLIVIFRIIFKFLIIISIILPNASLNNNHSLRTVNIQAHQHLSTLNTIFMRNLRLSHTFCLYVLGICLLGPGIVFSGRYGRGVLDLPAA